MTLTPVDLILILLANLVAPFIIGWLHSSFCGCDEEEQG